MWGFIHFFSDQTPTPTRFLKNCEEVGLFNELASPFENEFKKASEDDIKKVCSKKIFFPELLLFYIRNSLEKANFAFFYILLSKLYQ